MFHILVGTDGSESAYRAVHFAVRLAEEMRAKLTLAHVVLPPQVPPEAAAVPGYIENALQTRREAGQHLLEEQRDSCVGRGQIDVSLQLLFGSPASVLDEAACKDAADLVVVGTRGMGAIKRALLGSVSNQLSHRCRRPLLIVPLLTCALPHKGTRSIVERTCVEQ